MSSAGDLIEYAANRVFVVDDQKAITSLLASILADAGLQEVIEVNDSRDVPHLLAEGIPDLIILDLHMPHVDGYDLIDVVNQASGDEFVPMLVLTGDTSQTASHRAFGRGAHDVITKPIDPTDVIQRVRSQLGTRALHEQLRAAKAALEMQLEGIRVTAQVNQADLDDRRSRIEESLAAGGPRSVFQPVVELATGRVVGFEALARFDEHPVRGPDRWFADASDVGMSVDLEAQAARTALAGLDALDADQFLTINVSPSLVMAGLPSRIGWTVPWERVVIELTEHVAIEDYPTLLDTLAPIREAGARLAIDDTGAGFASMRHVLLLAPDILKLDISLCRGVDSDSPRRALASAMVAFAADIGAVIIAEGIETAGEHATLNELGVQYGQGYLLGRPQALLT